MEATIAHDTPQHPPMGGMGLATGRHSGESLRSRLGVRLNDSALRRHQPQAGQMPLEQDSLRRQLVRSGQDGLRAESHLSEHSAVTAPDAAVSSSSPTLSSVAGVVGGANTSANTGTSTSTSTRASLAALRKRVAEMPGQPGNVTQQAAVPVAAASLAGQGGAMNPELRSQPLAQSLPDMHEPQVAVAREQSPWSLHVWFSVRDWLRFALSVVIVLTLGQVLSIVAAAQANANSRIKDIVAVEGVRDNMLVGYGLVVGLNGTGDRLRNSAFTEQSLVAFLERLGVNTRDARMRTRNVAAVTVTATLPPFSRQGSRIDVSVSAMGDAPSLQGGTLLATPLYAADGQVYAVAQGALAIGGFSAGGDAATITKGVPTSAAIANGAIIEREVAFELNSLERIDLSLRNPDVTTAARIAATINDRMGAGMAVLRDPATVRVNVPAQYRDNVTMLLAQIEQLPVETDQIAKVVIDEASGTIVMGENVRVDTVAVAQGNLVVKIEETPQVSQPGAFAPPGAETVVVPRTNVSVEEGEANQMVVLNRGATLNELVAGLNALGVGPRDLITILQTIKAAGALQADIETR